jgi:CheY-like chemotaxis protein
MDPTLLLIQNDREEDVRFRAMLREAAPSLAIVIARNRDQVPTYPVPRLILLDLDLAWPPALDMLDWLRSGPQWEQIPVIVLSSAQETSRVNRAFELGANSCVLKPAKAEVLDEVAKGIGMYARLLTSQHA